jgi:hypothetical protein
MLVQVNVFDDGTFKSYDFHLNLGTPGFGGHFQRLKKK